MPSQTKAKLLRFESLEDRTVPAFLTVTTTDDVLGDPAAPASLRDAIRWANSIHDDNYISLPAGTYTLTRTGTGEDAAATGDLDVLPIGGKAITIYGAGKDQTIIDAAGIDRIFEVHPGARLMIMDATLRGGLSTNGGAVHSYGQLGIHYSIVTGNTATNGGAVYLNGTDAYFASQESLFENNFAGTSPTSGGLGGAINNGGGTIQIDDGVFRNNTTGSTGFGGAIYDRSGGTAALRTVFEGNRAGSGGAIATEGMNLTAIVDSTFTGNKAVYSVTNAVAVGGAIYGNSTINIARSTFTQNEALASGRGGALANLGTMNVVNSTISGNKAGTTVSGQYGAGAGIYNSGTFTLVHSTVTLNRSLGGGLADGIYNYGSSDFTIFNSIVAQNGFIFGNNAPEVAGAFNSHGGNLVSVVNSGSSGWVATDQVGSSGAPINARLGPLQNNGGWTATHAPRLDSRALDRGTGGFYLPNTSGVDQRNLERVVNNVPDVGAYEMQPRTNDTPVGVNDTYTMNEDGVLNVPAATGMLSNDTDADGDILDAEFVSEMGPTFGSLTIFSNGAFDYRPLANFHGKDSFSYRAYDGALRSEITTVTITIAPVNDAPVANANNYSVNEDTTLEVPVPGTAGILGNDTDREGDALTAVLVAGPAHGTLDLNSDGSFVYVPDENWHGVDSFTYKAFDGTVLSAASAQVTLTVNPVNDAPVATQGLYFFTREETPVSGQVTASDVDANTLTFTVVSGPNCGSLSMNPSGTFTYTPFKDYYSADTFTFRVSDGLVSDTASVVIVIDNVNDAPEAFDLTLSMNEDTQLADRYFSWRDVDSSSVTFEVLANNNPGDFSYSASKGSFSYRPPADFHGTVDYQFRVNDGQLSSNVGRVRFVVDPVNDAPTADAGADFAIDEAGTASFDGRGSSDIEGDSLTFSWDFGDGTNGSGATPSHAYAESGDYTVTLTVSDGDRTSSDSLVLTVRNLAPTASAAGPALAVPGQSVAFTFSASDPSAGDRAAGFQYAIEWGDGQTETIHGPAAGIIRSHVYTSTGNRIVSVTATTAASAPRRRSRSPSPVRTCRAAHSSLAAPRATTPSTSARQTPRAGSRSR